MTPEDFRQLQQLMAAHAGYRLNEDRVHLAEHRLGPVARREGYHNVEALLTTIWGRPLNALSWSVIEALLNSETAFRRDRAAFDIYHHELIPALAAARTGRRVRLWSAGCSTGQEAYSLAMSALEQKAQVDILATDLSHHAIRRASGGLYTSFEIQKGLSARSMLHWFEQVEDQWCARAELRQTIRFERANLLDDTAERGQFDVIFCRYVLNDMEPDRRAQVLELLAGRLVDDGCLFMGVDEYPEADSTAFRPVAGRKGLYVKAPSRFSRAA
ncbi:CheR family methyltransferase [Brevundimonas vesicularis]|uniref:CheR family methyltransferase n=1 Tax=Brevundimonas vesicularis TaxID=41276 RepID=UPI0038D47CDE